MRCLTLFLVSFFAIFMTGAGIVAQQVKPDEKPERVGDLSKYRIELPLELAITGDLDKTSSLDVRKSDIEAFPKTIVSGSSTDPRQDSAKRKVESAPASLVSGSSPENALNPLAPEVPIFGSKSIIEAPTELLVGKTTETTYARRIRDLETELAALDKTIEEELKTIEGADENPTVKPGLVQWHSDFETACAASKKSGKPVLLFHLLGKLDQRFT